MRNDDHGFTLIEMLVALAVFSIAALALLRLDIYAVATTADISERSIAELVAANATALAETDPGVPPRGRSSEVIRNGGRAFAVQRTVTPTPDARLVRIDIAVAGTSPAGRAARTLIKRVA